VKNEVINKVKKERNVLQIVKRMKANWIGQSLRRNCLLRQVIGGKLEGRIEVKGRLRRRRKQLLEIERGSNRSRCVENWLWKRLWMGRMTDC